MDQVLVIYRKYKFILWPILAGGASVVIIVLVIIPQLLDYLKGKDQINENKQKAVFLEAKAEELESTDIQETQTFLKVATSVLPVDRDVPQAVTDLRGLVESSGLSLKNIAYVTAGKGTNLGNSFQLNLTVLGPMDQVKTFLSKLPSSGRIFQVESIGLQFNRGTSIVEAELPISVYYEGVKSGKVGVDQPAPKLTEVEKDLLQELSQNISIPATPLSSEIIEGLEPSLPDVPSGSVPLGKTNPFE